MGAMSAARPFEAANGVGESRRKQRMAIGGILGVCAALVAAAVLFTFDPAQYGFYPVCAFHRTTGLLCPGCGASRAAHQLLHGDLIAAMHFNAFFVCSLPLLGWLAVRFAVLKLRNQPATINIQPVWLWSILVLLIVFGIARNLPFAHAAWLAP
jgi:hypothetical protein